MKRIKYINLFETKNEYDNSLNELPNVSLNYIVEIDKCKTIVKEEEDLTPETRLVLTEDSGGQVQLSANGLVIVEYIQDGEKVRNTYTELSDTYVTIPSGVEATVYGEVTAINSEGNSNIFSLLEVSKNTALTDLDCTGCTALTSLDISKNTALTTLYCSECTGLTSLDLSNNTALTTLYCSECTGLTSLDLSNNTALTTLDCNGCAGLTSLDVSKNTALTTLYCLDCQNLLMLNIKNTALLDAEAIIDELMANLTTLQVAGTSAWAYGQVENWMRYFAPEGGMIYVDENTPQSVIDRAQDKSWTVEYVN